MSKNYKTMSASPLISVIIPTKNGEKTIRACLESIFMQKGIDRAEVIIIDSGSEDGTLDIVSRFPLKIIRIKPEEFGHGRTRNLGIQAASGEFIFFTVQDAQLAHSELFTRALSHFQDKDVQAVGGKQIVPHSPDKHPLQWYRPVGKPNVETLDLASFSRMTNKEKFFYARLDNVAAMYRSSALNSQPFEDVDFGEDIIWAIKALEKGWKIIIDHNLLVYHYHDYSSRKLKERRLHEKKLALQYGVNTKLPLKKKITELARIFYLVLWKKDFVPNHKIHWLLYNLRLWWWK